MQKEVTVTDADFECFLNETYGLVRICGAVFNAGDALRKLDPIAFRVMKSDYETILTEEQEPL